MTAARATIALLLAAAGHAQEARFRIEPIDGAPVAGALRAIEPTGALVVDGTARRFELAELTAIERLDDPAPRATSPLPGAVWLRSGAELGCGQPTGHGTRLALMPMPAHAPVEIELRHVAALRIAPALDDDAGFARALAEPAATADLVFAWTRDGADLKRFSLRIDGVRGSDLLVEAGGRVRELPLSRVYGVVFGADNGAAPDPLPAPVVTASGTFGAPLRGALRLWDGTRCRIALAEGFELSVPCSQVARLAVDSGRVVFLSELEPAAVEQVPALDRPKPWLRDRTPIGDGIELGGTSYRRGLCLPPRTALRFALPRGEWDVFEATVGIDDRSHDLAHAAIRVRADDRVVFDSGPVVAGGPPRPVAIPLDGVASLTLETDFGENLDLGDHCVFAGARLRKDR